MFAFDLERSVDRPHASLTGTHYVHDALHSRSATIKNLFLLYKDGASLVVKKLLYTRFSSLVHTSKIKK